MSFLLHLLHFNLVPTQSPIFALGPDIHVNLSADYCISASKLSLLFASNIVFCHSNVAKWEIMGGPILKSFLYGYHCKVQIHLFCKIVCFYLSQHAYTYLKLDIRN